MRHRPPYDPLEVVVIDLEVETATLVAIHQASREALALRTECKTRHILDIGQTLDRRAGGEVVLEAAHGCGEQSFHLSGEQIDVTSVCKNTIALAARCLANDAQSDEALERSRHRRNR